MIHVELTGRRMVNARMAIELPMSATSLWGQMRDIERFATFDTFHHRVRVERPVRAGARVAIEHRMLGLRLWRFGRILKWDEGRGYCFSDLSSRSGYAAFPHVYSYQAAAAGPSASRLILTVRGRWTADWLPRPLVVAWLRWVLAHTAGVLRMQMLAVVRKRRVAPGLLRSVPGRVTR